MTMLSDYVSLRERQGMPAQAVKLRLARQLTGGVAHNFNNLLTSILGFSDFVAEELPTNHPGRPYLQEVRIAAQCAGTLIKQLTPFSRCLASEPRIVDLNEFVLNSRTVLSSLVGERNELVILPAPDLGMVRVDPRHMEYVLTSMAVNARDAMPRRGTLTIETANVTLDLESVDELGKLVHCHYVMLSI